MSVRLSILARLICSLGCLAAAGAAHAESLRMGLASEPTAADPHYHQGTPNEALASHIFEPLVGMNPDMQLEPRLAASWSAVDDLTWEFKLREGVRFSNGEPFGPDDVVFTLCRVLNNETSLSSGFSNVARRIVKVEVPDAQTVRLITATPYPVLPNELARVPVIWNGIAEHGKLEYSPKEGCGVTGAWPNVNDFNNGKSAIGTGPYVMKSYVKGTGIELTRNDNYWGEKPHWETVRMVAVPAAGPRLTGLLAGDFDIIENPAARDLPRIKAGGFGHEIKPSVRVMFFQLDAGREQSPMVKSAKGDNPLQDVRVRRAISMAIDRKAIVERIMDGVATPAYQFLPDGMFGTLENPPELKYDPAAAKALLAEAGYPDGFELTLSATNDRYINDAQVTQAVAQYLTRVGIRTRVDTMTRSVYFPRRAKREFSASLGGWGSETGEASNFIQYWTTTTRQDLGLGSSNYGAYSNPELDETFIEAIRTVDDAKRTELLRKVLTIALDEMPNVPLHFESGLWAFRKGLVYEGRADQRTMATALRPAQ